MGIVVILIKEIAESFIRRFRILFSRSKKTELNSSLIKDGIVKIQNFYSEDECKQLRNKIDFYIDRNSTNTWIDETGADHRVYFINEIDEDFNKFYKHPKIREALHNYTGITKPHGMLLAARIDAKAGNLGSGGGWHRDSPITHQFKAICYLNDVTTTNGPFMYIKGSHHKWKTFSLYLKKIFKVGSYRFNDNEISSFLMTTESKAEEVIDKSGTLAFVDTKGIHRGKPIEEGSRYVLFCYFWANGIPKHFEKMKQDNNELL